MAKTIEEKIAAIDAATDFGGFMGSDLVREGSLKNKVICGARTGYMFRLNNLSYRGVWLSTLENIDVWMDGEKVPHCDMSFKLRDFSCQVDETGNNTDIFWAAKDECWVIVNKVGGLKPGEHTLEVEIAKRNDFGHSYGEGSDVEGYKARALEFQHPDVAKQTLVCTIGEV